MLGGMQSGEMVQGARPCWEPLLDLVGHDVVGCFMWMCEVELDDGLRLHAYKSIATRRYLHLAADGRVFGYGSRGFYFEVTAAEAIAAAFTRWEDLLPPPPDPDAVRALLERYRPGVSPGTR